MGKIGLMAIVSGFMQFSMLQKIGLVLGFGLFTFFPILAEVDATAVMKDIGQYSQLSPEKKEALIEKLSREHWKKMTPENRKKIQLACCKRSVQVLGFHSTGKNKGKLKVVKDPGEKAMLKIAGDYLNSLAPENVPAHPSAGDLFGKIPAKAPRVNCEVTIDPSVVRWHSTGVYAAPGEVVTLVFPEAWINKDLKVFVSGHRDRISVKKSLMRLPTSPSRSYSVTSKKVQVAGTFGGAIYIDTGNKQRDGQPFTVTISNALQAPYFVLGKTEVVEWKNSLRQAPAPYAELVTDRIALSFPSVWVRDIEDPTELLQYWDRVVKLHDELGGMANVRFGPERVNVDVQISVGLFHAGYPAQGPQKQCRGVVDLEKLKTKGNWGWFHEMGHESQRRPDKAWGWNNPYTFDNSIETTVNLFSSHAMDRMKMVDRGGWSWTASSDEVTQRAHKILSGKKRYPELGAGEKLTMYLQLRDQFGWETIQKVLAGYSNDQDKQPDVLPKGNQAKRDAFLVRMSKASGHNLTPFLQDLWGIEMSPDAIDKVKDLPVWVPKGYQKYL